MIEFIVGVFLLLFLLFLGWIVFMYALGLIVHILWGICFVVFYPFAMIIESDTVKEKLLGWILVPVWIGIGFFILNIC